MTDNERAVKEEAERVVRSLTNFVNGGPHAEAFVDALMREHRTLQQMVFGLFLACMKEWARRLGLGIGYDLRNEWTCKKSTEIVEQLGRYNLQPPVI